MPSMPSVVLTDFCPVQVTEPVDQHRFIDSLAHMMSRAGRTLHPDTPVNGELRERVEKFAVSPEYIAARELNAVVPERLGDPNNGCLTTYPDLSADPYGLPVDTRMADNDRLLDRVFGQLYADTDVAPDDLVHVTSGGYSAPSPPQRYLAQRGWLDTVVSHVYHMGCFAAFPAVRAAAGALHTSRALDPANPKQRADVVHTEYFSLHVNLAAREPEDIISFTLFGDGFIRYSALAEEALPPGIHGLRVLTMQDAILPDSAGEMTWHLGTHNFALHLAKSVPHFIREHCPAFVDNLCARAGLDFEAEKGGMAFAIHTGGPKILDFVEESLGLAPDKLDHSRALLRERGNMSSAACPHLWARLVADETVPVGTKVLSIGFGPGLTVAGMISEKV